MKVTFTFDDVAMAASSIKGADVRHTVKKLFTERGLICIEDGTKLAFEDVGREDDYADMWIVILGLLRSEWFIKAASSTFIIVCIIIRTITYKGVILWQDQRADSRPNRSCLYA